MPWMEVVVIIDKLWLSTHYVQSPVRCFGDEEAEDSG